MEDRLMGFRYAYTAVMVGIWLLTLANYVILRG